MATEDEPGSLDGLPDEVVVLILSNVPLASRLIVCAFVCRRWRGIVLDSVGDLSRGAHYMFTRIAAGRHDAFTPALAAALVSALASANDCIVIDDKEDDVQRRGAARMGTVDDEWWYPEDAHTEGWQDLFSEDERNDAFASVCCRLENGC